MSFSFNFPSNRPMIQESQSMKNNGGGGNTGYFNRGKKKKDNEEHATIFSEKEDADTFVLEEQFQNKDTTPKENIINSFINKTKKAIQTSKKQSNNPFRNNDEEAV